MKTKTIGLASDHAGYALKQFVKQYLEEKGLEYKDGLCWIPEIAHLIRQHNDANVLVMPGRFIDTDMARKIMDEYFATEFEGGRHQKRIDKMPVK